MAINVELYKPHPRQIEIHNSINNEPYKYYILNIGRQFGKSLLATNQCCFWCFNEVCQVAWVSPIYKQAKKIYDSVIKAFSGSGIIEKQDGTNLAITWINGSTFQFFSAERYDNIRGFTFDYLVCDEFAFMDGRAWSEVLRATVLVRGKKVLLISTPNGKNHFHTIYNLYNENNQYKSFTMTSYDNPIINPKEIDDARFTLPEHIFRQEYLAEFIDGGAGIFKGIVINNNPTIAGKFYAGVDLGRADDYTVVSVFNSQHQLVCCERFRQASWDFIVKQVAAIINKYNAVTYVEVNSIGDAIFEQLKPLCKKGVAIFPFTTTSKSKNEIIEQLSVAIQNQTATILDIDWLKKEFDTFTFEYNLKTKQIRYSAPAGLHDDGVMATAIAYDCLINKLTFGTYRAY